MKVLNWSKTESGYQAKLNNMVVEISNNGDGWFIGSDDWMVERLFDKFSDAKKEVEKMEKDGVFENINRFLKMV